MIKNIKKLLNEIVGLNSEILFNPTVDEIIKQFRGIDELRFIIDKNDNYWIGDGREYIHYEIIRKVNLSQSDIDIYGFLYPEEHKVKYFYKKGWDSREIPKFKNTDFYKNLKPILDTVLIGKAQ